MLGKGSPTTEHRCSHLIAIIIATIIVIKVVPRQFCTHMRCVCSDYCPPILSYSLPSPICIPSSLLVLSSDSSPFFHKHFESQSYCGLKLTLSPGWAVTEFSIFLPLPSKQQGFQADSNTPGTSEVALTKECFASLSNLRSR